MEQLKTGTSRLFIISAVENKDDIEEKFERSYNFLNNIVNGLSEKEALDALNNAVCKDKNYEEISLGLLAIILTEPQNAIKTYRDLTLITRDGFALVLSQLTQLILERFLRLHDVARAQLLWILREMIRNSVTNVDNLCWNLMRHAAGGDVSPKNLNLIESLLDIFQENKSWLEKFPVLIASVVYTFLRLIEDHSSPQLINLRQKEVNFMLTLIRERFVDCLVIGRDFVRLLQNVARIPEFDQLWKDILTSPKSLCPSFNGVLQLLQTRTSRRFLQSRLTPEMERKLVFLTSQVRFGNHKRYQDWFQRQYLATPESQTLRCDMIRFIVGVIHPTNELLCSDIIPRWAVIGWLLTTCTSTVAVSNAKLALFYDWLFFEPDKDNIMNIEPAILVMHHSMRSHPAVSATLLDFLCRIIPNFYPSLAEKVRSGIFSSLRQILEKRVLPTLCPLFDNPKLDRELRIMVRETFKEFCNAPTPDSSLKFDEFSLTQNSKNEESELNSDIHINHTALNNHNILENEPVFSDDEDDPPVLINTPEDDTDDDDIPLAKVRLKEKTQLDKDDSCDMLNTLEGELKANVLRLQNAADTEAKCQIMETIVQNVIDADLESEALTALSMCLCTIMFTNFDEDQQILPGHIDSDSLFKSIYSPLFVMFRNLYHLCEEEDRRRQVLITLLAEMYLTIPKIGYLLLYFLKLWGREKLKREGEPLKFITLKGSVYKEFCQGVEKKVDVCLCDDLNECRLEDNEILAWILPDIFKEFKPQTVNNAQILKIIASSLDTSQLHELVCYISQGHLVMLKSDNLQSVLKASLQWDTFEQLLLWKLVSAHRISAETIFPILPHLNHKSDSEALTYVLVLLKEQQPTIELLKLVFSRNVCKTDSFVVTIIKFWCQEHMEKLGELISSLLSVRQPATSPNKRKRSGNKNHNINMPTQDQILGHLDNLREFYTNHNISSSQNLYNLDCMQRALQQAQNNISDSQKKTFTELFALAEEEEVQPSKSRGARGGRKPGSTKIVNKRSTVKEISESSSDSTEEEEIVKPKQAKKRKKMVSDSD